MTKQAFDNAGVAQVQSSILALPIDQRLQEIQAIRSDLISWLQEHFEFSAPQRDQLLSLPIGITSKIGEGVADAWQDGSLIAFNKDDEDEEEEKKSFKDLLYDNIEKTSYNFDTQTINRSNTFSVWIKYH